MDLEELKELLEGTNLSLESSLQPNGTNFRIGGDYYNPMNTAVMSSDYMPEHDDTTGLRVMLDDDLEYRPTPEGFIRYTSMPEAVSDLTSMALEAPVRLSVLLLDNDLGDNTPEGHKFLEWLLEGDLDIQVDYVNIHSQNIVAVTAMRAYLESAKRHSVWTDTKVTWYDLDTFTEEVL